MAFKIASEAFVMKPMSQSFYSMLTPENKEKYSIKPFPVRLKQAMGWN